MVGATSSVSVQQLAIYIPDTDRDGNEITDHEAWVSQALELLSMIGGGASAFEDVLGAWLNPETKVLIREYTTIVYSYVKPQSFIDKLPELRAFLHEFGRQTNQGEVLFHWDGAAYSIVTFDG